MPIYPYECSRCGYSKDVLQKLSDKNLIICPECGEEGFTRKLTAAGFVLKGSGWYVTDFRDGQKKAEKEKKADASNNKIKKDDNSTSSSKSEKNLSTPKTSKKSTSKKGKSSIKNISKPA